MTLKKIKALIMIILITSLIIPLNIQSANAVTRQSAQNICSGGDTNIQGSLILSIITGCLPGILDKAKQWREVHCDQIQCTYDAVVNLQIDPAFCKKQAAYETCKFIVGEIFALPPLAMIEYFKDVVAQIIANPIGLLYGSAVKLSRLYTSGACSTASFSALVWLCNVADNVPLGYHFIFQTVTDIAGLAQNIMSIGEAAQGLLSPSTSSCENIEPIIKEMKEIQNSRNALR